MGGAKRRTQAERKVQELREALRRQELITQRLASLAGVAAPTSSIPNSNTGPPRRLQHKLFIGNIESVTAEELEREFSRFGEISEVWIAKHPPGFGFVEYKRRRDAIDACQHMDDKSVFNSRTKIRVEFAKAGGGLGGGGKSRQGHNRPVGKPSNVQPLMEVKVVPKLMGSSFLSSVVGRQSPSARGGERRIRPLMEGLEPGGRGKRDSGRRRSVTPRRDRGTG